MGPNVVEVGVHGRARGLAIAARQGVDDGEVLVADLIDALGQAAEAEHGRPSAQIRDRGGQHGIVRGHRDGGVEVAVVLARRFAHALGAQALGAFARGLQYVRPDPAGRQPGLPSPSSRRRTASACRKSSSE